jgi:hypothetical protein
MQLVPLHLGCHPLMAATVGKWTIADFDLVVDEIQLQNGMGVAKIVRPASEVGGAGGG